MFKTVFVNKSPDPDALSLTLSKVTELLMVAGNGKPMFVEGVMFVQKHHVSTSVNKLISLLTVNNKCTSVFEQYY